MLLREEQLRFRRRRSYARVINVDFTHAGRPAGGV
jgi:hypothetical protein